MAARPDPMRLETWRALLRVHRTITDRLEVELREGRELPLSWYDVLLQLHEAGGRLRIQELATRVLLHKSSTSRLVDRLADAGYVSREPSPDDGRGAYAVLTRDGRDCLRRAAPTHLRSIQRHFGQWLDDDEVEQLRAVLAKLPGGDDGDEVDEEEPG
jgi:DNA-binding MarR family transcriptional regulator